MSTKKELQRGPLLCWDIYSMHLLEQAKQFNKQTEIEILKGYKEKFGWIIDIEKVVTSADFEALVLTDFNQDIRWVNKGFVKMTGYPANYAKGKKPKFLQGKDSSTEVTKRIKAYLKKGIHFKEEIINYRKNGKPYNCSIEIYPLKDGDNTITHLLALENEIEM